MYKSAGNKKIIWVMLYVIFGLLAALSIVQGCRNAVIYSQDFQWDAAKALILGINPYMESLNPTGALDAYGFADYFKQMEANQFPSLLLLLFPYTLLSPLTARLAWLVSNLVFTAGVVFLLRKTFLKDVDLRVYVLLVLLMIAGTPWRNQIGVGQHTIFAFVFFLLAVWLSEKRWTICASLSLAICYFKYTLTVPLALYFVYKRKWRELIISVSIHIILTIFSCIWLGESFLAMLIDPLRVSSALSGEGSLDISALLQGSPVAMVLTILIMVGLFLLALKMPKGQDKLLVSILLLWSLIVTYHRTYDYFVMILPYCYFMTLVSENKSRQTKIPLAVYTCLVVEVFFVLRIFSESTLSLIAVGAFYYVVVILLTIVGVRTCCMRKNF